MLTLCVVYYLRCALRPPLATGAAGACFAQAVLVAFWAGGGRRFAFRSTATVQALEMTTLGVYSDTGYRCVMAKSFWPS